MEEDNNPIQESGVRNESNNYTQASQQNMAQKRINSCALVSFIFSLVGLVVAGLPCGIVATITGIIGIAKFKPDIEKCKWMAITGLIVGILDIVIIIAAIVLQVAGNANGILR